MHPTTPPPLLNRERAIDERALRRAAGFARASALTLLILGGASLLVSVRAPMSASFVISVAVLFNGWVELRFARRLRAGVESAPNALARNQLALGIEIAAYAVWQAFALGPDAIEQVLRTPTISRLLALFPPEILHGVVDLLPRAVRVVYLVVAFGAFLGCVATAVYYRSRAKILRRLAASMPPQTPASTS